MNIRQTVYLLAALITGGMSLGAAEPAGPPRVLVGAIRWDAWHGDASDIGRAVQTSLSPPRWQPRLPFFSQAAGDGSVSIHGDTDDAMTREIDYAKSAHLDYWAFCAYDDESPMSLGLKRYLKNATHETLRFCLIGDVSHWQPETIDREASRLADLMTRHDYQTVLEDRPLLYILNLALESNEQRWAGVGGFRRAVDAIRTAARARGLADPYCVAMVPWPDQAKAFADRSRCDAISAYAVQAGGKAAPFADLTSYVQNFWQRSAETGAKIVPLAMTGWDRRPRVENPVFWERNEGWNADIERFYQAAKPSEIGDHVRKAVDWTRDHARSAEAQTVIIYAWNEFDEGGWICPTLGEGDARVRALGAALARP